jgi:hypothetical protein
MSQSSAILVAEPVSGPRPLLHTQIARRALRAEAEAHVRRISTTLRRSRTLAAAGRSGTTDLLAARRGVACDLLHHYQRFKHGRIFDPVVAHGPASSKVVARSMKSDCVTLGLSFAAFHARWDGVRAAEWPAYREDLLVNVDGMLAALASELRAIDQLLAIAELYGD